MGGTDHTAADTAVITASRLSRHVWELAAGIGERNVFHPRALQAAEDYIRSCRQQQGCVAMGGCARPSCNCHRLPAHQPGADWQHRKGSLFREHLIKEPLVNSDIPSLRA